MAWSLSTVFGGETQDDQAERLDIVRASTVTCDSTAAGIETGARCVKFPLATSASRATLPAAGFGHPGSANQFAYSGALKLSAAPSSEMGVFSDDSQGSERYLRIDTNQKMVIYDHAGNKLSQPTAQSISTSAATRFLFNVDRRQADFSKTGCLWVGRKWERTVLTANRMRPGTETEESWGEYLPAATNRGADLYADNLVTQAAPTGTTASNNDPAFLTKYPVIYVQGGASLPPTGNGTHTAWTVSDGGTADYTRVNEFPNTADTTWVGSVTNSQKETYTYSASNPFTSSHTIVGVFQRVVHKVVGAKFAATLLYRDDSGNESSISTAQPGTSYVGGYGRATRPAGGSWVYTDFDLSAGASKLQFGGQTDASSTIGFRWTCLPGPEVAYHAGEYYETGVLPWRTAAAICG